jgi:hypothetical protein
MIIMIAARTAGGRASDRKIIPNDGCHGIRLLMDDPVICIIEVTDSQVIAKIAKPFMR